MQYICPLCKEALLQTEQRWHCSNNHSFDIAKQGYTNLLPVQHKKSKSPGDDADMVAARHTFLSAGHYQPLADHLNAWIIEKIEAQHNDHINIIDTGCGEGYYTHQLQQALNTKAISSEIIGIDISKHAVKAAAKRSKIIQWFVANSKALPVADQSANLILSLFAPTQSEEFYRSLRTQGLVILATTGKKHLIQLRELIYDTVNDQVFDPNKILQDKFKLIDTTQVEFTLALNDTTTIKNLFSMTPHYWRVSPQKKAILDTIEQLSLTADIQLHCFQRL